jgi:polyribonucleotide nucleotidyltransferase
VKIKVEKQFGNFMLSFETGHLAKQASRTVIARYGDTVVLNAVTSGAPREGLDFFPLTCDYRERTAAAGKFPGGFLKREGRPTTKETLTSRLVDRPIRPMFAPGFKDEVQCQAIVLASDRQNDGDVLAMNGIAAAAFASTLPFPEPVASVRVGRIEGELIPFPTHDDLEESDLDMIVSGTEKAVTMIEGFAREMPESDMLEAIEYAHSLIRDICSMMRELREQLSLPATSYVAPEDDGLLGKLHERYFDALKQAMTAGGTKQERASAGSELRDRAMAEMIPDPQAEDAIDTGVFKGRWHDLEERVVRQLILEGKRADGRALNELREISCEVDLLPRVHGSAVFQRGETQALVTVTLGTQRDEQRVDGLVDEYSKKFMLDYNFPSFSVGECRPNRGPGRREIGHGALAERSIKPVLPDTEKFPYTIRVISDILESNGSSSMASVCGATLGLMDAGVPILQPVAGISIGLVKENDRYVLLTDIMGTEDHFGDMDFKIAGTQRGITGIQLDLKIRGITFEIIKDTLAQSRETRIEILRKMLSTIARPKEDISVHAPRLLRTRIDPEKIGMLIGPGGKNIRAIQESTDTVIEVDDEGWVTVASMDAEMAQDALRQIEACTATVQINKIYTGTVSSIKDFGAFVEILPGRDGLCHISELSSGYVSDVSEVCQIGDEMQVMVIDVDGQDRVKLSRKRALEELGLEDEYATVPARGDDDDFEAGDEGYEDRPPRRPSGGGGGGGGHRGGSGGGRGRSGGGGGGGGRGRSGGGGGGGRGRGGSSGGSSGGSGGGGGRRYERR